MIVREDYLKKLRLLKDQNLIKVITGIRRSGKSSLLQAFSLELKNNGTSDSNILFFNFEERENKEQNRRHKKRNKRKKECNVDSLNFYDEQK